MEKQALRAFATTHLYLLGVVELHLQAAAAAEQIKQQETKVYPKSECYTRIFLRVPDPLSA